MPAASLQPGCLSGPLSSYWDNHVEPAQPCSLLQHPDHGWASAGSSLENPDSAFLRDLPFSSSSGSMQLNLAVFLLSTCGYSNQNLHAYLAVLKPWFLAPAIRIQALVQSVNQGTWMEIPEEVNGFYSISHNFQLKEKNWSSPWKKLKFGDRLYIPKSKFGHLNIITAHSFPCESFFS